MASVDGVDEVTVRSGTPTGPRCSSPSGWRTASRTRPPLEAVTAAVQRDHPELEIRQAGDLTMDEDINDQVADDLSSAEGISLPVTLVLMLLAFGALIAAGIPVLLAATSVAATIGHHRAAVPPRPRRGAR